MGADDPVALYMYHHFENDGVEFWRQQDSAQRLQRNPLVAKRYKQTPLLRRGVVVRRDLRIN
jgi:hypothetical protein